MKYFVVVGRSEYWRYELNMIGAKNINKLKNNIVIFELEDKRKGERKNTGSISSQEGQILYSQGGQLSQCSQIIKRGKILNKSDLFLNLKGVKIIGIDQKKYGIDIKKKVSSIKRFKQVNLLHSDLEIKNQGKEIVCLDGQNDLWGVVEGYQDINLFEKIDFGKPFSGMNIGMMPSKLTLFLINLGIGKLFYTGSLLSQGGQDLQKNQSLTIWDPFAGFGTTGFLANYLGYNFIGSDLNISSLKGNLKWRKNDCELGIKKHQKKTFFTIFKHDVTNSFKQKFLTNVDIVVTEGRLGPILKNNHLSLSFLKECQEKVWKIQKSFILNLLNYFGNNKFPIVSMTIPYYFQNKTSNIEKIHKLCQSNFLCLDVLDDIYHRKGQLVGRQIIIIKSK